MSCIPSEFQSIGCNLCLSFLPMFIARKVCSIYDNYRDFVDVSVQENIYEYTESC